MFSLETEPKEVHVTENALVEHARGEVVEADGAYAGTTGRLKGRGMLTFNADGTVSSTLIWVLRLKTWGSTDE